MHQLCSTRNVRRSEVGTVVFCIVSHVPCMRWYAAVKYQTHIDTDIDVPENRVRESRYARLASAFNASRRQ